MAGIVDTSYFFGPLEIGQVTNPAVAAELNIFIAKYEAEFLRVMLGAVLYSEYRAGIVASTPLYLRIRDGYAYTGSNGSLQAWEGLKRTITEPVEPNPGVYESPIANYIFCEYMRAKHTFSTGSGEKKVKGENSEPANPGKKIVRAWNEMVDWNRHMVDFLYAHDGLYNWNQYYYNSLKARALLTKMNPLF